MLKVLLTISNLIECIHIDIHILKEISILNDELSIFVIQNIL